MKKSSFIALLGILAMYNSFGQFFGPEKPSNDSLPEGMIWIQTMTYPHVADTTVTVVDIRDLDIGEKVVYIPWGKVIFYIAKEEYLKTSSKHDTVLIKPRYMKRGLVNILLKEGKVKIYSTSSGEFINTYTHYQKQYGSMVSRMFELPDGKLIFMITEIFGVMPEYGWTAVDSVEYHRERQKDMSKTPIKEFAYKEEFADPMDSGKIKIKDYFVLEEGRWLVYQPRDNPYDYRDTIKTVRKEIPGGKVYVFAEHQYPRYTSGLIDNNMVGWPGLYFYRGDTLFGIDVEWERQIKEYNKTVSSAEVFLPSAMSVGDSIEWSDNFKREVTTFLGFEDLIIEKDTLTNCAKFKIVTHWRPPSPTIYLEYFWLKKDIGLVRRDYSTGLQREFVETFQRK